MAGGGVAQSFRLSMVGVRQRGRVERGGGPVVEVHEPDTDVLKRRVLWRRRAVIGAADVDGTRGPESSTRSSVVRCPG